MKGKFKGEQEEKTNKNIKEITKVSFKVGKDVWKQ
jgi:hypothetical protein